MKTTLNGSSKLAENTYKQYSVEQIKAWLFDQDSSGVSELPTSKLKSRDATAYAAKATFESVPMTGTGRISSRVGIFDGGITDLRALPGQTAAVGDSNNGDFLTGCGYAVEKAVVNAAGPGLQVELYNNYGAPAVMDTTDYGKQNYSQYEGRGYAISCDAYDMKSSHGIQSVELLIVPMWSEQGVVNMYLEALIHSKDKDFIALPMAGMTHPVLNNNPEKSAQLATEAVKQFFERFPESPLKIIFVIWQNPSAEAQYRDAIGRLDSPK